MNAVARAVPLVLRLADKSDIDLVWTWNSAPDVRAVSRDLRPLELEAHRAWFAARLARRDPMWIIEEYGTPVGVVRIDRRGTGSFISIALPISARGRGIGRFAIRAACEQFGAPVTAVIRTTNAASRACFSMSGFELVSDDGELATYHWSCR